MQDKDTSVNADDSSVTLLNEGSGPHGGHGECDEYERTLAADLLAAYDIGLNVAPAASEIDARSLIFGRPIRAHLEELLVTYRPQRPIYVALGYTSGNLFAVACSTRKTLKYVCDALKDRDIARWAMCPGLDGYGAGLLLFRSKDGHVPRQVAKVESGDAVGIYSSGKCLLLPPHIDANGEVYQWLYKEGDAPPEVHLADLEWLGVRPNLLPQDADPWHTMPSRVLAFLTTRVSSKGAETQLFAAAYEVSARGIPRAEALEKLLPAARRNKLSEAAVNRAIESAYSRECQTASALAALNIDRAYAWIEHHEWTARTMSARIAACALLKVYPHAQDGVFAASYIQIEQLTRQSPETIRRALEYLQEAGFIKRLPRRYKNYATRWQLADAVLKTAPDAGSRERVSAEALLWDTDARERAGIGVNGLLVFDQMLSLDHPARPRELAERCQLNIWQVRYVLRRKLSSGPRPLVSQTDEGWIVVRRPASQEETPQWLDEEVAAPRGVRGKGKQRRYALERKRSKWILAPIDRALFRRNGGGMTGD